MTRKKTEKCPAAAFQKMISGKYKLRIIWKLKDGPQRYNEIKRGLLAGHDETQEVAPRVLSRELKQLCEFKVISRMDFQTHPPKVEYSLTDAGVSFLSVIESMHKWGMKYI